MLLRIFAAAALFVLASLLPIEGLWKLVAFLVPYGVIGWDVLWKAARNIVHGQVFDENFLMTVATVGALVLGEYAESVFVMLFYQVGELFQSYAVGRSRKSIADLMDICPEFAWREGANGQLEEVDPAEVEVGEIIVVKPGERVPLDGVILEGESALNTAALTGESLPRQVAVGDAVISGCINMTHLLRVQVEKAYEDSTVSRILELVEDSAARKAKTENFITRFARYYTPAVVIAAVLLALLPPLVLQHPFAPWVERALTFLVISCPCALVISVPLSFFGGIGAASRQGILVKGGSYLEALAKAETVVFDKTGTLTEGRFTVTEIHPEVMAEEELLRLMAMAESASDHPIAQSVCRCAGAADASAVESAEEIPGKGIRAVIGGVGEILAGNSCLLAGIGLECPPVTAAGTVVHTAVNGVYAGYLVVADAPKAGTEKAIARLKAQGVKRCVMLTGDREETAQAVASALGMDEVHAQLLPADKVAKVEVLLEKKDPQKKLVFVGDGINDAPVLSRADIGIAMGAMGSDAAIEAADIVLMKDDPADIAAAMGIARKTVAIVWQNIVFALGVKGVTLALGALGLASMWMAVFADVGVAVIAILNAMRTLKTK